MEVCGLRAEGGIAVRPVLLDGADGDSLEVLRHLEERVHDVRIEMRAAPAFDQVADVMQDLSMTV